MKTLTRAKTDVKLQEEWLRSFLELKNQIKTWVYNEPYYDWSLEDVGTKEVEEAPLGSYTITIHEIRTPEGVVRLEPVARNYPGRGIVELYAWPTLRRVRLIQEKGHDWKVLTDSGIYLRAEWNRSNFIVLVQDLIAAG